jgi:hypothetical protein
VLCDGWWQAENICRNSVSNMSRQLRQFPAISPVLPISKTRQNSPLRSARSPSGRRRPRTNSGP